MRTRKLLSGLGAAVMSLMMIIPWAVYADSPQVEDSSIVTESSAALYRWRCGGSAYNDRAYG